MTRAGLGRLRSAKGQALIEFALIAPLVVVVVLGVVEVSYALYDAHVVTRLSREGANLISRDVALDEAATALAAMSTRPVDFGNGSSKVIFSVIRKGAITGTTNFGRDYVYQRFEYGGFSASSRLPTTGAASFSGPDSTAPNADNDANLRVTLPAGTTIADGGTLYVAEIYSAHELITPFDRFGISLPRTLYSIAYF